MAPRRVLVTGASGFIGRHLVAALLANGAAVTVLARAGSALPDDWPAAIEVLRARALLPTEAVAALDGRRHDAVFHLAAAGVLPSDRDADRLTAINIGLTAALARHAAATGAVLVSAGSSAEYREPGQPVALDERQPLETGKLYGATKAAGGIVALATAAELGGRAAHLRLFNVYGPGEAPHRLIPAIVARVRRGERVPMSTGTQVRDFVHVDDVVAAMLSAARHLGSAPSKAAVAWNVGTGAGTSVRDLALLVAAAAGAGPEALDLGAIAMRPDEVPYLVADCRAMAAATGFTAAILPAQGVARTIAAMTTPGNERKAEA